MTSDEGTGPGDTRLLGVFVSLFFSGPGDTRLLGRFFCFLSFFLFVFFCFSGPTCDPPHAYERLLVGWFDNYS
jgi:hypothetical protein